MSGKPPGEKDMKQPRTLGLLTLAVFAAGSHGCGKPGSGSGHTGGSVAGSNPTGGVTGTTSSGGTLGSGGTRGSGGVGSGGVTGTTVTTGAGGTTADAASGGSAGTTSSAGTGPTGGSGGTVDGSLGGTTGTGGTIATGGTGVITSVRGGAAGGGSGGATGAGGAVDAGVLDGGTATGLWSMGYYASWDATRYPISEIDWSGLTHIAMAFYTPRPDGSLSLMGGDASVEKNLVAAAHQNGVKAVASIGGADSQADFKTATASGTVAAFASRLVALLTTTGYDGIDIDWEPMDKADEPAIIDIATRIRQGKPEALITLPIGEINVNMQPDLTGYPAIAAVYDQLNIMSYGQAGAWQGWKSWHSSALYHTDSATPTSIDSTVKLYLAANVPAAKLGIGIGFYGLCYTSPVTGPDQALSGATVAASDGTMSYANIMTKYYSTSARQWDDLAKVPYLSFSSPQAPDNCTYISYDDEESIAEKAAYVKANGLGGVIQWELNEGYLSAAAAGQRNPLLKAIHDGFLQ
jgi:chitinase